MDLTKCFRALCLTRIRVVPELKKEMYTIPATLTFPIHAREHA